MIAPPIKQSPSAMSWFARANRRYPRSAIRHMAWKELRQIAPLIIVFVALMVFTLIAASHDAVSKLPSYNSPHQAFWFMAIVPFISMFSMTLGVFLFAPEKENKTSELLSRLPITSGFVIRSKVIAGLLSILGFAAIGAVCQLVEWFVFNGSVVPPGNEIMTWGLVSAAIIGIVLIPLECFFWGVVCSVAINRTVYAALAATGCVVVLCWMIPGIGSQISTDAYHSSAVSPIVVFVGLRIVILLAGVVLFFRFGKNWLGNSPQVEPVLAADFSHAPNYFVDGYVSTATAKASLSTSQVSTATEPFASPGVAAWPMYRALIWQSFRQYQWSFLIAIFSAIPFAFIGFVMMLDGPSSNAFINGYLLMLFSPIVMTGVGALFVFGRDHRDGSYRFFQQHIECGKKVWFARMLPVCILAFISLGAIGFAMLIGMGFARASEEYFNLISYVPLAFIGVLAALAIGQFNSLLFCSGVFSFAFTIAMGFITLAWMFWLNQVGANPWLYLAPVLLAMLAIGWWWTPRWLAGKNRISQLVIPHALVVGAAIVTIGAFSYQRYSEVPPVAFSLVEEHKKFNALDSNLDNAYDSARLIGEAVGDIEFDEADDAFGYTNVNPMLYGADPVQGAESFLAENEHQLAVITKAIESQDADAQPMLDPKSIQARDRQANKVRFLLAVAAKHAEAEDELEKALEYWALLLRFDESYHGYSANNASAVGCILRWSNLPNQTPELMKKAIEEIGFTNDRWQRLSISSEYFGRLDFENWYAVLQDGQSPAPRVGFRYGTRINEMPSVLVRFESARSRRVAHSAIDVNRWIYDDHSHLATQPDLYFSKRWGISFPYSFWASLRVPNGIVTWDNINQKPRHELFHIRQVGDGEAVRDVLLSIQDRRYAQVRLALRGWKFEHDKYPESLKLLAPKYFRTVPVDVFYGGSFAYSPTGMNKTIKWTGDHKGIQPSTPFVLPWSLNTLEYEPAYIENFQSYARISSQFSNVYDYTDQSKYVSALYTDGRFVLD